MDACARHAGRPALIKDGQPIRYDELAGRVETLASRLLTLLWPRPGDVVALQLANSADFVAVFFALMRLGVAVVLLNTRWKAAETSRALNGLPIKALITSREILAQEEGDDNTHGVPRWATEELMSVSPGGRTSATVPPAAETAGDRAALLLCTSGTTGLPKLAVRSHQGLLANAANVAGALGVSPGCRVLSVVPFYHANGFSNCLFMPLLYGATLCVMRAFDPAELAAVVAREKVDLLVGSPFIYSQLAGGRAADYASVRTAISSGAALPAETESACRERLGLCIRQLYGSSETGTIVIQSPFDNQPGHPIGLPLPGVEISILDLARRPVPPGGEGEIAVRSPAVMSGYWGPAGLSRAGFENGFFRTGDLGCLDGRGRLVLRGRVKKHINVGGVKVDPEEIAQVLRRLPGVEGCCVHGVPHPVQTEVVAATVTVKADAQLSRRDVVAHCRRHLAESKIPRQIIFSSAALDDILGKQIQTPGR